MKRTLSTSVGVIVLAIEGISCSQPQVKCTAGHGGFAATYALKAGSMTGTGDCDKLAGETIGVQKYNPAQADNPEKEDTTRATLAIKAATLGDLAAIAEAAGVTDKAHPEFSVGDFDAVEPDENDICMVSTLLPAQQKL